MQSDSKLRLLALLFGLAAWLVVRVSDNSLLDRSVTQLNVLVPIEVQGVAEDLVAYNLSATEAKITMRGNSQALERLQDGLVECFVDVSGLKRGGHSLELNVLAPGAFSVVATEPETLKFILEDIGVASVPVKVVQKGVLPIGSRLNGMWPDQSSIQVTGPSSLIQELKQIELKVPVDHWTSSQTVMTDDFDLIGNEGENLNAQRDYLKLEPSRVQVLADVRNSLDVVKVPLGLSGIEVRSTDNRQYTVRVEPSLLEIKVSADVPLPDTIEVESQVIDPQDGLEVFANLIVPPGVEVVGEPRVKLYLKPVAVGTPRVVELTGSENK